MLRHGGQLSRQREAPVGRERHRRGGLRVGECTLELEPPQPRVQRHGHCARPPGGNHPDHERRDVARHHGHPLPGLHGELGGQGIGGQRELAESEHGVSVGQRMPIAMLGQRPRQKRREHDDAHSTRRSTSAALNPP